MKGLLALGTILAYFIDKNFTRPLLRLVNHRVERILQKQEPEEIWLKAEDGIKLHGRYISGGENCVLLLHGYHSSPSRDFSTMIPYYREKGYSLLFPDLRSHGKSGGYLITFGEKESQDALLWIQECIKRGAKKILIHGVSMGAATTLLLRDLPLPAEVCLTIVDSPYLDAYDQVLDGALKKGKALTMIIKPLSSLLIFAGLHLKDTLPIKGLKRIGVPMLLLHGTADTFVPTRNSVEAYVLSDEERELHLFEGSPHAREMKMYPKEYREVVDAFIKKYDF